MKQCTKCKEVKPFTDFTKGPDHGYRYQCRACNLAYQAKSTNRSETAARYYAKRKETNPQLFLWKQAKHRATFDYQGMEFTIQIQDIVIPKQCPYMKVEFQPLDKKYGYSLDRIDSTKGYTKENIQVISRIANIMKNNATEQELISFAKGVLEVHQGGLKDAITM